MERYVKSINRKLENTKKKSFAKVIPAIAKPKLSD